MREATWYERIENPLALPEFRGDPSQMKLHETAVGVVTWLLENKYNRMVEDHQRDPMESDLLVLPSKLKNITEAAFWVEVKATAKGPWEYRKFDIATLKIQEHVLYRLINLERERGLHVYIAVFCQRIKRVYWQNMREMTLIEKRTEGNNDKPCYFDVDSMRWDNVDDVLQFT